MPNTDNPAGGGASSSDGDMPEAEPRKCVICKSPLNEGAVRCLACKGFQNPLRRFLSNLDVKSLVALVPVVTLAFAFLQDRFSTHRSEVYVTALECSTTRIELLATNSGDRAGVIKSARVLVSIDGKTSGTIHSLRPIKPHANATYMVVKPEDQAFITMIPMEGQAVAALPRHPVSIEACTYQMTFDIIEFQREGNEIKTFTTSCGCPE